MSTSSRRPSRSVQPEPDARPSRGAKEVHSSTVRDDTLDDDPSLDDAGGRLPGVVAVFIAGEPVSCPVPLGGVSIELGRAHPALAGRIDPRMSRAHARVWVEDGSLQVLDLGSSNGTWADGVPVHAGEQRPVASVLRLAETVFVFIGDLRPFSGAGVRLVEKRVQSPLLGHTLESIQRIAKLGGTAHISGESGSGKEAAARIFHEAGPAAGGPFVAVNCAAIPPNVAERLLFGARKGAFSGAVDNAEGYFQAADGGTLFLDEIGELGLEVQAKLLRVLETREVLPLGGLTPRKIDVRLCSASHRDLREEVAAGRLREDLYFRVARPSISLPPLRDRIEEIPWLIGLELGRLPSPLRAHASFVEACMLRPWPGNVRELLVEVRSAAYEALGEGTKLLLAKHLAERAGLPFARPAESSVQEPVSAQDKERLTLEQALDQARGNVSATAKALGISRGQLRRLLARHQVDPQRFLRKL